MSVTNVPRRTSSSLAGFRFGTLCLDIADDIVQGNFEHASAYAIPVLCGVIRRVPETALTRGEQHAVNANVETRVRHIDPHSPRR